MSESVSSYFLFLLLLSLPACLFPSSVRADHEGFFRNTEYNEGEFGDYVTQSFHTTEVDAPILNVNKPFTQCDDGSYIFITPRGEKAPSHPFILDHSGAMIWSAAQHYGQIYNFQVQRYRDEDYLCFWAGNDAVGGHGVGKIYMYDKHYELYRTVVAGNGLGADLHSFVITPNGTAVFTAYDIIELDLSSIRGARRQMGYIWDSLFQELDLETNEVLFQWRASEHRDLRHSYNAVNDATEYDPWDWFHINSVEKDDLGNYLVSSRYLRGVMYISGETGDVLWQLGGRANNFRDEGGSSAISYIGQHDAHWLDEPVYHGAITLFDNRADWAFHTEPQSRGTRVGIDVEHFTAKLDATYENEVNIISTSQGSYQSLPNGNVLIGYGFNGVISEYASDGTLLCDAYFEPSRHFTSGNVQSYRNLKFNWTGIPKAQPNLMIEDGALYMSWMGSTQIRKWLIQDALTPDGRYDNVFVLPKAGFETHLGLSQNLRVRPFVRAVALDEHEQPLAHSSPVDIGDHATVFDEVTYENEMEWIDGSDVDGASGTGTGEGPDADKHAQLEQDVEDMQLLIGFGFLAALSALLVCWFAFGTKILKPFGFATNEKADSESWTPRLCRPDDAWHRRLWYRIRGRHRWQAVPQHDGQSEGLLEESGDVPLPRIIVNEGNAGTDER